MRSRGRYPIWEGAVVSGTKMHVSGGPWTTGVVGDVSPGPSVRGPCPASACPSCTSYGVKNDLFLSRFDLNWPGPAYLQGDLQRAPIRTLIGGKVPQS